jgi:hypothetical protein
MSQHFLHTHTHTHTYIYMKKSLTVLNFILFVIFFMEANRSDDFEFGRIINEY